MNCPKCNTLNDDNAAVCINCGELLDTEDEFAPALDKNARLEEIQLRRMKKKIRQRRKKIIAICIVLVAVAAAAAYGVYNFKNNMEETPDNNVIVVTPSALPTETPEPTALPEETIPPEAVITDAPVLEEPEIVEETPVPVITKKPAAAKKPVSAKPVSKPTAKPIVKEPFPAGTIVQAPVVQGNPISSQLTEVISVETAAATGKSIAKLLIGGETYFAYANADTFSLGVPGTYSIDAVATEDVYFGLPVYNITDIDGYLKDGYVIADSSARLLTEADLQGLSKAQLEIARNEIFARHGRAFKRADMQSFFESRSWYKQNENYNYVNDYSNLSDIELANSKFILAHEN